MKSISFSHEVFYFVRNVRARSTTNFPGLYWGVHIQDKMCKLKIFNSEFTSLSKETDRRRSEFKARSEEDDEGL